MSKIIGNTTTTPVPRSDWEQVDKTKADFIRHKPTLGTIAEKDAADYYTKSETDEKLDEAKAYTDTITSGLASTSTVDTKISTHNTSSTAHSDIRELITNLTTRLNALANSTDEDLDQMAEIVAYIKSNKSLIDSITTSKINVSDIVDNLTTSSTSKVLSAKQGVAIKALIDALDTELDSKADASTLTSHTGNKSNPHGVTAAQVGAYTKSEIDSTVSNLNTSISGKAAKSTTLSGYGITDAYTKTQVDTIASGKSDTGHSHTTADITDFATEMAKKADASHGTHVTWSTTSPKMDGTATVGSETKVARGDHVHPTDTSRASKSEFDSHDSNTTKHITSTERTNWGAAYTHSQAAHAPSNAQANVIESIKVNGTAQTISSKAVDITVPTKTSDLTHDSGFLVASDIANKANKATTLSGYGITDAVTSTTFDSHDSNTTKHITSTERTNWNAAKTHADSTHAPSNAQPNQNAFSNIAVSGQTTVAADTTTDTVTFAGSNVSITTDATNDKITFTVADGTTSAKGVVQLTNSTSSTSTTTAATPSSVKSAYDRASTAITNAATAQTKADSAYTLAESKVDSLSDLGITATATELNYVDGVTSNIQTQLDGKASSSHGTHVSYGTSATAVGATASAGSASTVSRSDHTHSLSKSAVTTALGYTPPTTDTVYTHPTTAGNKHIPSGGSSGQILKWSASGTAVWGTIDALTESDIDSYQFITTADIDTICSSTISAATMDGEVRF